MWFDCQNKRIKSEENVVHRNSVQKGVPRFSNSVCSFAQTSEMPRQGFFGRDA